MATGPRAFYCLWQEERVREILFELLSKEDICSVRLANSACCNLVTKRLFLRTNITFTANSFTKASKVQALSRIGHHIEHLTFNFHHSEATFIPPLVHPQTGQEISFLYTPYTHLTASLTRPKYNNSELADILTQQYPPLFHAATNVPSFINAVKQMPNMRHLTIKSPGQDARERYRRSIVDYALISLRISVERTNLPKLSRLTLSVHPTAFNYLRHMPGFGCTPSAPLRWRQIKRLYISVESWDFYGPAPGLDHLKIIDDYIRNFAPNLEKLSFTWLGRKGPCPMALARDPLFAPPRGSRKLFNEVTSPMSPLPPAPGRQPIHFPKLKYLTMRNATMNERQVSEIVRNHQATVREFDFENVVLIQGGSWDEALAPLTDQTSDRGSDVWSRHSLSGGSGSEAENLRTASPKSGGAKDVELPSPSAAVAAASRELLDLDLEGLQSFLGLSDQEHEHEQEERPRTPQKTVPTLERLDEEDEDEQVVVEEEDDDSGMASDLAAAKEASVEFSAKIKKKRVRRRRKHNTREDDDTETEERHRRRHRHENSDRDHKSHRHGHRRHRDRSPHGHKSGSRPRSRSSHSRSHHSQRHERRPETPPPPMPEVILAEGDDVFSSPGTKTMSPPTRSPPARPQPPSRSYSFSSSNSSPQRPSPLAPRNMDISAPMLSREPLPSVLLLKPTVYDPSAPAPAASSSAVAGVVGVIVEGTGAVNQNPDDGLSPIQRNLEQEEAHRILAIDAEAQTSALQKAKAAVLSKLGREFYKPGGGSGSASAAAAAATSAYPLAPAFELHSANGGRGSCAAEAASNSIGFLSSGFSGGLGGAPTSSATASGGGVGLMGFRLREGLFGGKSSVSVSSHHSMDSNSAMVPLMFSSR